MLMCTAHVYTKNVRGRREGCRGWRDADKDGDGDNERGERTP